MESFGARAGNTPVVRKITPEQTGRRHDSWIECIQIHRICLRVSRPRSRRTHSSMDKKKNMTIAEIFRSPPVKGSLVALASFAGLGTVSALWENPIFIRMTPVGGWEIGLLALLSVLIGMFVAIRSQTCATKSATAGGVLGFLGIACPICNKILLLLFGGELLMTYYEPVRIYVAMLGVIVAAGAVWRTWRKRTALETAL